MTNAIQTPLAGDAVEFPASQRPRESEAISWLGELRKAQAGPWFQGPAAASDAMTEDAGVPLRSPRRQTDAAAGRQEGRKVLAGAQAFAGTSGAGLRPREVLVAGAGVCRTSLSSPKLDGAAGHDGATVLPPVLRQEAAAITDAEAEVHAGPVRAKTPIPGHDGGPRVHVEDRPEGLAVWVGMDGDAAAVAVRAAAILSELRRGVPGGGPLALLVCNGRTLYVHPAAPHMPDRTYEEDPR